MSVELLDASKALLGAYSRVQSTLEDIDSSIECCVRRGFYTIGIENTMRLYVKIIRYNGRKKRINNLKSFVESSLEKIPSCYKVLLMEKCFNNKPVREIAIMFHCSSRTAARMTERAYASFNSVIGRAFKSGDEVMERFGEEPIFRSEYKAVLRQKDKNRIFVNNVQRRGSV